MRSLQAIKVVVRLFEKFKSVPPEVKSFVEQLRQDAKELTSMKIDKVFREASDAALTELVKLLPREAIVQLPDIANLAIQTWLVRKKLLSLRPFMT